MALLAQRGAPVRDRRASIVLPVGRMSPDLRDTVAAQDGSPPSPWPATSVLFSMRPLLSRAPVVNGAAGYAVDPPDVDGFNVGYAWSVGDRAVPGEFMAWWGYVLSGGSLEETPEFPIIISDHGPGLGYPIGVVVDGMTEFLSVTVENMRHDPSFGDRFLQRVADRAKRDTMGVVVTPDAEAAYDPALVQYLSMRAAILLVPSAKEWWGRQYKTLTSQGPVEIASYPDMIATLDRVRLDLMRDAADLWRQLQFIVPNLPQRHVQATPASSLGDPGPLNQPVTPDPYMTPSPRVNGPEYGWWGF